MFWTKNWGLRRSTGHDNDDDDDDDDDDDEDADDDDDDDDDDFITYITQNSLKYMIKCA